MGETFVDLSPPYGTIVADPPWPYDQAPLAGQRESGKTSFLPYSTMSLEQMAEMPVKDLGCVDAHLFMWTTNGFLWDAKPLAEAWGFRVRQVLVWCKPPAGKMGGGAFRPTAEFVLVCRRRFGDDIRVAREKTGLTIGEVQQAVRGGPVTGLAAMWEQSIRYPNPVDWVRLSEVLETPFDPCGNLNRTDRSWWEWPRGHHSAKPAAFADIVERVAPGPYVELFARDPRLGWDAWGLGYESAVAS